MRFVDELLIKYARKLEDENAPELITVAMREGAEAIRQLDEEVKFLRAALERIAFGKYHWEADAQEEARAALNIVDLDSVLAPPKKDSWE